MFVHSPGLRTTGPRPRETFVRRTEPSGRRWWSGLVASVSSQPSSSQDRRRSFSSGTGNAARLVGGGDPRAQGRQVGRARDDGLLQFRPGPHSDERLDDVRDVSGAVGRAAVLLGVFEVLGNVGAHVVEQLGLGLGVRVALAVDLELGQPDAHARIAAHHLRSERAVGQQRPHLIEPQEQAAVSRAAADEQSGAIKKQGRELQPV
jgi:hypothetical protein